MAGVKVLRTSCDALRLLKFLTVEEPVAGGTTEVFHGMFLLAMNYLFAHDKDR